MNVPEDYLEVMEKFDFSWEGKGGKKRAGTGYSKVVMIYFDHNFVIYQSRWFK